MEIFELGTEKINVCGGNSEGIVVLIIYHILFIFYLLIHIQQKINILIYIIYINIYASLNVAIEEYL